jgi:Tfp pilus assembly protein PilX
MTRRLRIKAEDGYTMAAVMLVLLATSIMAGATFAAVGKDIPFTRASQDRKQAYAAAEAGIEYYLYQLTRDNDYWKTCDTAAGPDGQPNPVNNVDPTPAARRWRTVAGTTDAKFSIELLPANKAPKCEVSTSTKPTQADDTMIDKSTGTFRIRSTGMSRGVRRSIVTTFRRNSFLDFIYFTDYEALDPLTIEDAGDRATALSQCVRYRTERTGWCDDNGMNITFPDWDRVKGPLHTNDSLLTCGNPVFGRGTGYQDVVEIGGLKAPGWEAKSGCGGSPSFQATVRQPWEILNMPASNERLKDAALTGYLFYGQTEITLNGTLMTVKTHTSTGADVTYTNKALPTNGVVFVEKVPSSSCVIDSPANLDYDNDTGCAILTLHKGSYAQSLTLGSRDDILIDGDVTQTPDSDSVLGLIAQRFVRVKHDVNNSCGSNIASGTLQNLTIEAAILALNDSFIVDNWRCGDELGTLTVKGAIAQKFRGPVGTFRTDGGRVSGYAKNYNYDDRLRYRSPPYFLEPVKASWKIVRNNEQVPAAK